MVVPSQPGNGSSLHVPPFRTGARDLWAPGKRTLAAGRPTAHAPGMHRACTSHMHAGLSRVNASGRSEPAVHTGIRVHSRLCRANGENTKAHSASPPVPGPVTALADAAGVPCQQRRQARGRRKGPMARSWRRWTAEQDYFNAQPIFELQGRWRCRRSSGRGRCPGGCWRRRGMPSTFDADAVELRPVEDRIELRGSTGFLLGVYAADAKLEGLAGCPGRWGSRRGIITGDQAPTATAGAPAPSTWHWDGQAAETVLFAVAVAGLLWLARAVSRRLRSPCRGVDWRLGGARPEGRAAAHPWQVCGGPCACAVVLGLIVFYVLSQRPAAGAALDARHQGARRWPRGGSRCSGWAPTSCMRSRS